MTMRAEWGRLDKHRVDKYYNLMRQMVRQAIAYVSNLDSQAVGKQIVVVFEDEILKQKPNGPRLHLADVLLDELVAAADGDDKPDAFRPPSSACVMLWIRPCIDLLGGLDDATVMQRILERIVNPLVGVCHPATSGDGDEDEDEAKAARWNEVPAHVQSRLFELASDPATRDENREALYAAHKQLRQLNMASTPSDSLAAPPRAQQQPAEDAVEEDEEEEGGPKMQKKRVSFEKPSRDAAATIAPRGTKKRRAAKQAA